MDYDTTTDSASRFSRVTDTEHAGNLWILAILATAYSILTASIRFRIKSGVLGADDGLFGMAMVCTYVDSILIRTPNGNFVVVVIVIVVQNNV